MLGTMRLGLVMLGVVGAACTVNTGTPEVRKSTAELRALALEINELRAEGADESGVALDLSQDIQRKFVEARLQFVGKDRENSPNLFRRIESGAAQPTTTASALSTNNVGGLAADCSSPLSVIQDPNDATRWEARVITSCFAGADYSYVDLFWWDSNTGSILSYDFREDFTNPRDLVLGINASAAEIGVSIHVDSMTINSRGLDDYFYFNAVIQQRPDIGRLTSLVDPLDKDGNGTVVTCLDRGGIDCDYYFTGTSGNIMLPINMTFNFPGAASIMSATAQVHMTNSGGVCRTNNIGPFTNITSTGIQINTGGPISFGNRCVNNQTNVRFWVRILAVAANGSVYRIFWANDMANDPNNFALQFRWSCLAEGSEIEMADGTIRLIEDVAIGEQVSSRGSGRALTVVDITRGVESAPMVEVEDHDKNVVLVTQGHPFFNEGGDAIRADALLVGAKVQSVNGLRTVTRIDRRQYDGRVYNFKLGTEDELAGLNVSRIDMVANGYRVGDARSQWELEVRRQQKLTAVEAPKAEWTFDYVARRPDLRDL